jgi:hypothetical protein
VAIIMVALAIIVAAFSTFGFTVGAILFSNSTANATACVTINGFEKNATGCSYTYYPGETCASMLVGNNTADAGRPQKTVAYSAVLIISTVFMVYFSIDGVR